MTSLLQYFHHGNIGIHRLIANLTREVGIPRFNDIVILSTAHARKFSARHVSRVPSYRYTTSSFILTSMYYVYATVKQQRGNADYKASPRVHLLRLHPQHRFLDLHHLAP